jgi:hypothetical protein
MRYVADLVSRPGVERHVLDLVELVETPAGPGGPDRHRLGDAGPQVDARARTAYRRRLEELREELDDADALEDDERAFEVQAEIEQVVAELGRALGLGGRDRRAAAAAERARVNVTRAIRAAVARIEDALPAAGRELDRAVRTGLFCAYEPPGGAQVLWRRP